MTITTLIIVIGVGLGSLEIRIPFESAVECHKAMDNFYMKFYRKIDEGLILPPVKVECE